MRICHVIESVAGGSAAVMVSLAVEAASRGHDVSVVYSPDRADPAVLDALRTGGVDKLVPTQMRRSIGPWDALDGWRLRKVISSVGVLDVVHSHSSKAGVLARTIARPRRTAQIYSPHGFYTMTGEAPFYIGAVERALSRLSDRIIAVSDFERRHALELGIAADKVVVVPNGIRAYEPMDVTAARAELGLAQGAFVIGFVGRLAAQKDPFEALRVIDAVRSERPTILAIIGDGELRETAERAAASRGSRAQFLGPRDAKPLFSAFDCLLCTSRYEGMSVAFLEALNCGVPIISYPVGGAEELVAEGQTGFVVEPTPEAAAAAIAALARAPPDERQRMAEACRSMAAKHDDKEMSRQTLNVYESVLKLHR